MYTDPDHFKQILDDGLHLARMYDRYGLNKHAKRVRECNNLIVISCGVIETVGRKCRDRFCPGCSRARIFKFVDRLEQLRERKLVGFVTWTWAEPLMPDIYACKNLRERQRHMRCACGPDAAGVWKWEFTRRSSGGLHAHIHSVIAGRAPQDMRKIFSQFGVRDMDWRDWDGRTNELAKYFCKPMDFDAIAQLVEAMTPERIRLTDSFGLRRPTVKKPDQKFIQDFQPRTVTPPMQVFRVHSKDELERLT